MTNKQLNSGKARVLVVCGVMLVGVVTAFWTLSSKPLSNHECFVSVTTREMLANKDFVWPTFNGQSRLQKTPLNYWLVAGFSKITGQIDEFTTRLPSAVFGLLTVAAILYFVSRQFSFRIATLSACVWATSLGFTRYSHNGRPEMTLTFFVALCFLSFYSAVTAENRRRQVIYILIFWVGFALANLAKGPMPLPMVGFPLFLYVLIFRQWKKISRLLPITGAIIFLAIVLPWPVAIAQRVNWDLTVWKQEFIDRFFGDFVSGNKPFYYYIGNMFQFILPWVAFVPGALAAPFFKVWDKKRSAMWFYWLWFVADVVFLSLSGGKRQHYILPAIPALSILIGVLIEDMIFTRQAHTIKQSKQALTGHIIVLFIIAVAGPVAVLIVGKVKDAPLHFAVSNFQLFTNACITGAALITAAAVVAALFAWKKRIAATVAVFAGITFLCMLCYVLFIDPLDCNEPSRQFSQTLAAKIPASGKLAAFEYVSNRSIYYFGRKIPEIKDCGELFRHYDAGGWVVATMNHLEKLQTDKRFRMVYYRRMAERRHHQDAPGAVFHKSAPAWTETKQEFFDRVNPPGA